MVEHMADAQEGPGGSLGPAGGEVVRLPGLVCLQDVLGMVQVPLLQPEIILWSIAFEADQEFWPIVLANQAVGENICDIELFFSLYQLWGWLLMRGSNLRWAGVVGFQILHILKWGESGKVWWDFHLDSVGSSELQHFEGS